MYAYKTCEFISLNMVDAFLFSISGFSVTFVRKFMNVSIFELVSSILIELQVVMCTVKIQSSPNSLSLIRILVLGLKKH